MTNYQKDQAIITEDIFSRNLVHAKAIFDKKNTTTVSDHDIFRQAYLLGVASGVTGLMQIAEADAALSEEDEGGECAEKPDGISQETWEIMLAKMDNRQAPSTKNQAHPRSG